MNKMRRNEYINPIDHTNLTKFDLCGVTTTINKEQVYGRIDITVKDEIVQGKKIRIEKSFYDNNQHPNEIITCSHVKIYIDDKNCYAMTNIHFYFSSDERLIAYDLDWEPALDSNAEEHQLLCNTILNNFIAIYHDNKEPLSVRHEIAQTVSMVTRFR